MKDPKDVQSVLTGEDGGFEFGMKAGKYSLHGAKRGFISSDYNQHEQYSTAIVAGADVDTEHLTLTLAPSAVLTGRVLDESGEPVRDATVILWREDHMTGVSRVSQFRQQASDDLGTYEFAAPRCRHVLPICERESLVCGAPASVYTRGNCDGAERGRWKSGCSVPHHLLFVGHGFGCSYPDCAGRRRASRSGFATYSATGVAPSLPISN